MGVSGPTTSPPNPTIASITSATQFTLSSNVTTASSGATFTATGCGLQFSNGTSSYTDTMATTTNAINASTATAGAAQFYVRTSALVSNNGWTFQVSPDGGTTWVTCDSESYAGDTVNLTGCTLNAASTTVTCASTTGLATGMTAQGTTLALTACGTTSGSATVTCANTTGLAVGMYLTGSGIANNTYVTAITPNTSFTISANATATNTSEGVNANYLNANTTISSITNSTTFVLSAGPSSLYSGSGLALAATTINHNYTLEQCTIPTADLTANMKLRFQFSGYNGTPPNQPPTVDIDDVVVNLTAPGTITTTEAMTNASGNVYSAQIPAAVNTLGATVSYYVTATDSNSLTSTDPSVRRPRNTLIP